MVDQSLSDFRILLVEDNYLLAEDFKLDLEGYGATIIGPVPTLARAQALYDRWQRPRDRVHFAILDVNLRGTPVYPFAHRLVADGVPFVFCTGYGHAQLDDRFPMVPCFEKPLLRGNMSRLIDLILVSRSPGRSPTPISTGA